MNEAMGAAIITVLAALASLLAATATWLRSRTMRRDVDQIAHNQNALLTSLLAAARAEGYRDGFAQGLALRKPMSALLVPPAPPAAPESPREKPEVSDR
jgi:hypothetical protein